MPPATAYREQMEGVSDPRMGYRPESGMDGAGTGYSSGSSGGYSPGSGSGAGYPPGSSAGYPSGSAMAYPSGSGVGYMSGSRVDGIVASSRMGRPASVARSERPMSVSHLERPMSVSHPHPLPHLHPQMGDPVRFHEYAQLPMPLAMPVSISLEDQRRLMAMDEPPMMGVVGGQEQHDPRMGGEMMEGVGGVEMAMGVEMQMQQQWGQLGMDAGGGYPRGVKRAWGAR